MYAIEQIKEYLKPEGRIVISNLKKEINLIADQVREDEIVKQAGLVTRGFMRDYLAVLTSERLLTTDKSKNLLSFDLDTIGNVSFTKKLTTTVMNFTYEKEEHSITFNSFELRHVLLSEVKNALNNPSEFKKEIQERNVVRIMNPIKMRIDILNGKEQLKDQGNVFKLMQTKHGFVDISVNDHAPERFKLIKWDRVDNVQKSALDIVGWTTIGSAFGNAGAIAGAMGANVGKDKSVATLFLKRVTGEKVPLVIKCDKKDLEKLSLLIATEDIEGQQVVPAAHNPTAGIPTEDLIKLKELMDAGILTQEEFDAKKKQLLGI